MSKIQVYSGGGGGDENDCTSCKITPKCHKFKTFIQLWHYRCRLLEIYTSDDEETQIKSKYQSERPIKGLTNYGAK